ncbi:MAG: hypothetical protein AB7N80_13435 [Bdellovibrionales bacterium]
MFDQFEPSERYFRYLMISWITFSAWAIVLQSLFRKRLAAITSWNYSPGWQTEIALWNVGAVVLLALSLIAKNQIAHITVPVICVWSTLFGINHLIAYVRTSARGHLNAAILNLGAVVWAAVILFTT